MVVLERVVEGVRLRALRGHDEGRVGLEPIQVGQRQAVIGGDLDLPGLDRRRRRRPVGNEAPHHAVQIRETLAPIVGVAVRHHVLAALVAHELERAGADRRVVGRVLQHVGPGIDVLRYHVAEIAQGAQQQVERHRLRIAEHGGMLVRRVDRDQVLLQLGAVVELGLPQLHSVVLHVGGGKRLAVVPLHALAQMEGDGFAVRRGVPPGRQHPDRLAIRIQIHQRLHHLAGDGIDAGGRAQGRVQDALLAAHVRRQRAATRDGGRRGSGHAGASQQR